MPKLRLAILGCGAVTERHHLPAAAELADIEVVLLADRDRERAEALARTYGVAAVATDPREAIGVADAAIVALPHALHAPFSIDLLSAGVHVLVEKPMALNLKDAEAMQDAARRGGATLAVGHMRRFLHSSLFAKAVIDGGHLGRLLRFDFREGNVFNWPVSSDAFFRREAAGGGVLVDTGSHTLDLLLWWLGEASLLDYRDDGFGGVEADCEVRLRTSGGAEGIVQLSRSCNLRNTAILVGERGELEIHLRRNQVSLTLSGEHGETGLAGHGRLPSVADEPEQESADLFVPQLRDFADAILKGAAPRCPAREAVRSVALMEACYARRKPLELAWALPRPAGANALRDKTVLVTGGTGFIGGRLVERLVLEHGARVRVLVRNFSQASRVGRFPLEMRLGDVVDAGDVAEAAKGCDYVFHCAYDFAGDAADRKKAAVRAAENICQAALNARVRRLVHVSTFAVYGDVEGDLDEASRKLTTDDPYALSKRAAEAAVASFREAHGLPVVVIQPTIVYGPFSKPWAINPALQLTSGRVVLPNDGSGLCNAVYVDDVVDAMLLAALKDEAEGETFIISGPRPITWKEYYGALEAILGSRSVVTMPVEAIRKLQGGGAGAKTAATLTAAAHTVRKSIPKRYRDALLDAFGIESPWKNKPAPVSWRRTRPATPPRMYVPDKARLELLSSKARVRIDKARRILNYTPAYDFEEGIELTGEFLRWANLGPAKRE